MVRPTLPAFDHGYPGVSAAYLTGSELSDGEEDIYETAMTLSTCPGYWLNALGLIACLAMAMVAHQRGVRWYSGKHGAPVR